MDYTPLAKWDAQDTQHFAHVSMVDIASGRSTRSGNSARRWVVTYLPRKKLGERLIPQHDIFIHNIYMYIYIYTHYT